MTTSFVTWLLVILGWVIVNSQHNHRENRKEYRAAIDKISTDLVDAEKKAIEFHTSDYDELSANLMVRQITRIARKIASLGLLENQNLKMIIDFRSAITFDNFEKSTHKKLDQSDKLLYEISDSCLDIQAAMEESFRKKFKQKNILFFTV